MPRPATPTPREEPRGVLTASPPQILWLHDPRSLDAGLVGAKAANLSLAGIHGLPILPGFVLTTSAGTIAGLDPVVVTELRAAWQTLAADGAATLVVRSSSTVEDSSTSSMAGQFTSVLGVRGWDDFLEAIAAVMASAARPRDARTDARPMGVLVQPQLDPVCGGVLFGLDPVSGDRRHVVVEAVPGTPDELVSGTVTAAHCTLTRRGRLVGTSERQHRTLLTRSRRRRLARLADRAAWCFDGPQDIEWAIDGEERLWLLQARAVTAAAQRAAASGPVLGPGPVAETFPDPLRPLEIELWIDPLRDGVAGALRVTGAVGRRRIAASPVVTAVGGRVAADLELFGITPPARSPWRILNPLPGARRLVAAWRVGRLRAALPALAQDLLDAVDAELVGLGDLAGMEPRQLLDVTDRARGHLVSLHGHEVLAGMLLREDDDTTGASAAALALAALQHGRADGLTDAEVVARAPVVLALRPPTLGPPSPLPGPLPGSPAPTGAGLGALGCREALRLRCRWMQELSAQVTLELGARLAADGVLESPDLVRELTRQELLLAVEHHRAPTALDGRPSFPAGPPLPVAFRLDPASMPVAVVTGSHGPDGLPASAGRATGLACHDPEAVDGTGRCILVVDTLDPRLASALPGLAGLVSATGSALSHLAILAREMGVPAVVAVPEARARFPVGSAVLVDGGTGEVRLVHEEEEP